ncbi:hypothetical protein OJAV_G00184950 [Oryzias javanicus]|uniref:Uncharacterized protein n=1 Tax=Oryzias javanicus TaxID=123683 RepID=A0A3S2PGY6_ORYJA|nr:hypothetical protein OJAV_G00184950 [Oryzias javanicus]
MGPSAGFLLLLAIQAVSAAPVNENSIPVQTDVTSAAISVGSAVGVIAVLSVTVFLLIGAAYSGNKTKSRACVKCCCWLFNTCADAAEETDGK